MTIIEWHGETWPKKKDINMDSTRYLHCGIRLRSFQYTDECPHCHEELTANPCPLTTVKPHSPKLVLLSRQIPNWLLRLVAS